MTEEELAKAYFEYTNRGWRSLPSWDELSKGAKELWIERAKKAAERSKL